MLHPQRLAVEGEIHFEGQPIHEAVQEALGSERQEELQLMGGEREFVGNKRPGLFTALAHPRLQDLRAIPLREKAAEASQGPPEEEPPTLALQSQLMSGKSTPPPPASERCLQTLREAQGSPNTHLGEKLSLTRSNSTLCT